MKPALFHWIVAGCTASLLLPCVARSEQPAGPEFQINTYTFNYQWTNGVASDASGQFVVVWYGAGQDNGRSGVFARRYDASGTPLAPTQFRVNTYTSADMRSIASPRWTSRAWAPSA